MPVQQSTISVPTPVPSFGNMIIDIIMRSFVVMFSHQIGGKAVSLSSHLRRPDAP